MLTEGFGYVSFDGKMTTLLIARTRQLMDFRNDKLDKNKSMRLIFYATNAKAMVLVGIKSKDICFLIIEISIPSVIVV